MDITEIVEGAAQASRRQELVLRWVERPPVEVDPTRLRAAVICRCSAAVDGNCRCPEWPLLFIAHGDVLAERPVDDRSGRVVATLPADASIVGLHLATTSPERLAGAAVAGVSARNVVDAWGYNNWLDLAIATMRAKLAWTFGGGAANGEPQPPM